MVYSCGGLAGEDVGRLWGVVALCSVGDIGPAGMDVVDEVEAAAMVPGSGRGRPESARLPRADRAVPAPGRDRRFMAG